MSIGLREQVQKLAQAKRDIEAKEALCKKEGKQYKGISSKEMATYEKTARNLLGDYSQGGVKVKEALMTTDAIRMIPKIIEGQLREAAEPELLAVNFLQHVNVDGGSNSTVYVIPVVGEIVAGEVAEGGRYNQDSVEFTTLENKELEIRVKKVGVKVSISEEAVADSSWDILGINIRKMSRAMARFKEELIFNNFSMHGHTIFDNALRAVEPEAGTTGLDKNGEYNDTLSVEDFIDMVLALMAQGYNPSDIIFHPLVWLVFAKNSMIGNGMSWGAMGGQSAHQWGQIQGTPGFAGLQADGEGQKFILRPDQVQNRLPMPLAINFSPFVKFDKINKKFDMYAIDRSEVGVLVQKESMSTNAWSDPEKDIRNLKTKERYGVGILNNGRAIGVIKNLSVAPSYPQAPVIKIQNQ